MSSDGGSRAALLPPPGLEDEYAISALQQLDASLRKHALLKKRNWKVTCCEICSPAFMILILVAGYALSDIDDFPAEIYADVDVFVPPEVVRNPDSSSLSNNIGTDADDEAGVVIGNATVLQTFSLDDLYSIYDTLQELTEGPLPIPSFDAYVTLSDLISQNIDADTYNQLLQNTELGFQFGNLFTLGSLHFAPDSDATHALVRYLNDTTLRFQDVHSEVHASESAAVNAINKDLERRTWALIVLNQVPSVDDSADTGGSVRYKLRMNSSTVPNTNWITSWVSTGLDDRYQRYFFSGFLTLQQVVDDFFFNYTNTNREEFNVDQVMAGAADDTYYSLWGESLCGIAPDIVSVPMPTPAYSQNIFYTAVGYMLGIAMCMSTMYPMSRLCKAIVEDKESKMRETMKIMGLRGWVYVMGWFITALVTFSIITVIITFLVTTSFISASDPWLILTFIFLFMLSLISFAFLLSVFFSRAKLAAIIGPVALFASVLPRYIFFGSNRYEAAGKKYWCSLLSPAAFSFGADIIADWEYSEIGISWENYGKGDYSLKGCMILLFIDFWVYAILAWYLEQVLPTMYGTRKHPLFFLEKDYWALFGDWPLLRHIAFGDSGRGNSGRATGSGGGAAAGAAAGLRVSHRHASNPMHEPVAGSLEGQEKVTIEHLWKRYDDGKLAVRGLDLAMYESQITCLLGHNGAGKTSTISMLTGLIEPTRGDCWIYGMQLTREMARIREITGVCPQTNVVFPTLTVREHLIFFGRLKGIPESQLEAIVAYRIAQVGLTEKTHVYSSNLSGGMKRKLCLAISLVGNPKFVLLDEPTSGLDPYSRRSVWNLLRSSKQKRVVVLTTHFMDEADILGDRIAIMSHGKLKTCGSALFLKNTWGLGYNLVAVRSRRPAPDDGIEQQQQEQQRQRQMAANSAIVVHNQGGQHVLVGGEPPSGLSQVDADNMLPTVIDGDGHEVTNASTLRFVGFIRDRVPDAELLSDSGGEIVVRLPLRSDAVQRFPELFRSLDASLSRLAIDGYGVSVTTLEEVFLRLAKDAERERRERHQERRRLRRLERACQRRNDARAGAILDSEHARQEDGEGIAMGAVRHPHHGRAASSVASELNESDFDDDDDDVDDDDCGDSDAFSSDEDMGLEDEEDADAEAEFWGYIHVDTTDDVGDEDLAGDVVATAHDVDTRSEDAPSEFSNSSSVRRLVGGENGSGPGMHGQRPGEERGERRARRREREQIPERIRIRTLSDFQNAVTVWGFTGALQRSLFPEYTGRNWLEGWSWLSSRHRHGARHPRAQDGDEQRQHAAGIAAAESSVAQGGAVMAAAPLEPVQVELAGIAPRGDDDGAALSEGTQDNNSRSEAPTTPVPQTTRLRRSVTGQLEWEVSSDARLSTWEMLRELVLKRFINAHRDKKGLFFQIVFPALQILLVMLIFTIQIPLAGPPLVMDASMYPPPGSQVLYSGESPLMSMPQLKKVELHPYPNSSTSFTLSEYMLDSYNEHDRTNRFGAYVFNDTIHVNVTVDWEWVSDNLETVLAGVDTLDELGLNLEPVIDGGVLNLGDILEDQFGDEVELDTGNVDDLIDLLQDNTDGNETIADLEDDVVDVLGENATETLFDRIEEILEDNNLTLPDGANSTVNDLIDLLNSTSTDATNGTITIPVEDDFTVTYTDISVNSSANTVTFSGVEIIFGNTTLDLDDVTVDIATIQSALPNTTESYGFLWNTSYTILHNSSSFHAVAGFQGELTRLAFRKCFSEGYDYASVNHPLPLTARQTVEVQTILAFLASIFILIPLSYTTASFCVFLVKERSCKSKHLQFVSGVNPYAYWVATYAWDVALFTILVLFILSTFAIYRESAGRIFLGTAESGYAVFMLLFLYGLSGLGNSYLYSFMFDNHSTAQIAIMGLNFSTGFVFVIAYNILINVESTRDVGRVLVHIFRLFPPYCVGEGLLNVSLLFYLRKFLGSNERAFDWDITGRDLTYMAAECVVFFSLVLISESKVIRMLQKRYDDYLTGGSAQVEAEPDGITDRDVLEEKERIAQSHALDANLVLRLHNLRKTYPAPGFQPDADPKRAVRGLYLGVEPGEVFGLLGINGAGKTSTLSVITGDTFASGGDVSVCGFDIEDPRVRQLVGYCPQQDPLLPEMTGRETLRFFGRLRGLSVEEVDDVVEQVLKDVSLTPFADRRCGNYSGGNKRKLSLGVALVGSPSLLLLDEPSSGVDPESRRHLYDVIADVSRNRSVVLTTHSMEEAEALCSRVGVMVGGQQRCIGSVQHLKLRFAKGYFVQMRCNEESGVETVRESFQQRFPSPMCRLKGHHGPFLDYILKPADGQGDGGSSALTVDIADVFEYMTVHKETLGIADWSITSSSLETIFISFAKKQAEETGQVDGLVYDDDDDDDDGADGAHDDRRDEKEAEGEEDTAAAMPSTRRVHPTSSSQQLMNMQGYREAQL